MGLMEKNVILRISETVILAVSSVTTVDFVTFH